MAAQHLPRDLVWQSSGLKELSQKKKNVTYLVQESTISHENFSFIITKLTSHNNDSANWNKSKWKFN